MFWTIAQEGAHRQGRHSRGDLKVRRQVLVIQGEASIQNTFALLLDALNSDNVEAALNGRRALVAIEPASLDAVLLDLRSLFDVPQVRPEVSSIQLRPIGRILFVTGEVSGPDVFRMIEQNCGRRKRGIILFQTLWQRLLMAFNPAESASEQIELAAGPEKL
ncbi:MAG TPA: hypothetical protein VGY31_16660 [Terriglobia bacterium]|nr:hypothetical protein [Terriglobia bacterium]